MRTFPINTGRYDPYKNYRFLVHFIDKTNSTTPVAAVSKVTGLKRSSDVIDYKEGGDGVIRKGLGRTKYEAITLERGVTHDPDFETWADAAQALSKGVASANMGALRRTLQITLLNEAGQPAHRFIVHRCWVSEYQALPDLDAGGNAVALEHIKLENEGWERDPTIREPDENL